MLRLTLASCLSASMLIGAPLLAEDPLTIRTVTADPESYHLRQVTLLGTVRQVHELEPYLLLSGSACYGAYVFTLEDETGALDIIVLGVCGAPMLRTPAVSVGDRVIVRANVQAPGRLGTFYGLDRRPIEGLNPQDLHAIASEIRHASQ